MLDTIFLTAALAYAEAGIAVFPCLPDSKIPACEHGHLDATTNPEAIQQWWSENPSYNIGIDPASAGWTVVDADLYKPGAAESLAQVFPDGVPLTYSVQTPQGGIHYYFEGSLPTTSSKLGFGIDTRGNHTGYVLAPPSVFMGASYAVASDTDISPLPPGLIGRSATPTANSAVAPLAQADARQLDRARRLLRDCVSRGDVAIEGSGGDARTYAVFAQLRDLGVDQDSALTLIEEVWNPECIPPWNTDELELKAANAYAYAQNVAGAWDVAPADQVFSLAMPTLEPHPGSPPKKSRFTPEDDDDMDREPDGKWLVEGVIPDQTTVLMYGPTGSYKSFVALDIALALATGKETFGQKTEAGCVFYGALEGAADIKRARRPAWRMARGITGKTPFMMMPAPRIGTPGEMDEFAEQIQLSLKGRPCRLIVLDTASKMMVGSDATKDVPRLVAFCDGLVERFKCSVLVIHHTGRDVTKGPRDSSAYEADFDSVIRVSSPARHVVEVMVEKHKAFDAGEAPYTFQGHKIGKSLVLEPTSAEQHAKLTQGDEMFGRLKVGHALIALNAYGQENGVTGDVLLGSLGVDMTEKSAAEKARKALAGLVRVGKLDDYQAKVGKDLIWSLPAKG